MKKIEEDTLKREFYQFRTSSISTGFPGTNLGMATTTGDTTSGNPSKTDDCDSDSDTTSTGTPGPLPFVVYNNLSKR